MSAKHYKTFVSTATYGNRLSEILGKLFIQQKSTETYKVEQNRCELKQDVTKVSTFSLF